MQSIVFKCCERIHALFDDEREIAEVPEDTHQYPINNCTTGGTRKTGGSKTWFEGVVIVGKPPFQDQRGRLRVG
ncbi:MAG: hypothetical protein WBP54_01940 [Pelodictyon phaeoclathratiforme]